MAPPFLSILCQDFFTFYKIPQKKNSLFSIYPVARVATCLTIYARVYAKCTMDAAKPKPMTSTPKILREIMFKNSTKLFQTMANTKLPAPWNLCAVARGSAKISFAFLKYV